MLRLPKRDRPCEATHRPGMKSQAQILRLMEAAKRPPARTPAPQWKPRPSSSGLSRQSASTRSGECLPESLLRLDPHAMRLSVGINFSQASAMALHFARRELPGNSSTNSIFDLFQFRREIATDGLSAREGSSQLGEILPTGAACKGRAERPGSAAAAAASSRPRGKCRASAKGTSHAGAEDEAEGRGREAACVDCAGHMQFTSCSRGEDELWGLPHGTEDPKRDPLDCQVCAFHA